MIYLFTIKGDSVYKGEYYIDSSKNIYCYSYDIYTVTYDKVAKKDVDFSSGIIMLGDKLKYIENTILDISIYL